MHCCSFCGNGGYVSLQSLYGHYTGCEAYRNLSNKYVLYQEVIHEEDVNNEEYDDVIEFSAGIQFEITEAVRR